MNKGKTKKKVSTVIGSIEESAKISTSAHTTVAKRDITPEERWATGQFSSALFDMIVRDPLTGKKIEYNPPRLSTEKQQKAFEFVQFVFVTSPVYMAPDKLAKIVGVSKRTAYDWVNSTNLREYRKVYQEYVFRSMLAIRAEASMSFQVSQQKNIRDLIRVTMANIKKNIKKGTYYSTPKDLEVLFKLERMLSGGADVVHEHRVQLDKPLEEMTDEELAQQQYLINLSEGRDFVVGDSSGPSAPGHADDSEDEEIFDDEFMNELESEEPDDENLSVDDLSKIWAEEKRKEENGRGR